MGSWFTSLFGSCCGGDKDGCFKCEFVNIRNSDHVTVDSVDGKDSDEEKAEVEEEESEKKRKHQTLYRTKQQ